MVNRCAEAKRQTKHGPYVENVAALFSTVALFAITSYTIVEATGILLDHSNNEASIGMEVDMRYVLGFGIVGILFDSICLTCFYLNNRMHRCAHEADACTDADLVQQQGNTNIMPLELAALSSSANRKSTENMLNLKHVSDSSSSSTFSEEEEVAAEEATGLLNMRSALTHSAGDLLRSTATIVSGSVALVRGADSTVIDAVCAIAFSIVIALGGCGVVVTMCRRAKLALCRSGDSKNGDGPKNTTVPKQTPVA
jgi:Co/Zn/Cd efflux system component